jgi:hypothetical protein
MYKQFQIEHSGLKVNRGPRPDMRKETFAKLVCKLSDFEKLSYGSKSLDMTSEGLEARMPKNFRSS